MNTFIEYCDNVGYIQISDEHYEGPDKKIYSFEHVESEWIETQSEYNDWLYEQAREDAFFGG